MSPATREAILDKLFALARRIEQHEAADRAFGERESAALGRVRSAYGEAVYAWNVGDLVGIKDRAFRMLAGFRQLRDNRGARSALGLARFVKIALTYRG
jgi:hypothetical protein